MDFEGGKWGGEPFGAILDFCYVTDNKMVRKGKNDMVVWCKSTISLGLKMRWFEAKDAVVLG